MSNSGLGESIARGERRPLGGDTVVFSVMSYNVLADELMQRHRGDLYRSEFEMIQHQCCQMIVVHFEIPAHDSIFLHSELWESECRKYNQELICPLQGDIGVLGPRLG